MKRIIKQFIFNLINLKSTIISSDNNNNNIEAQIVGGYEVNPPFKYPFMVRLISDTGLRCGGSLYNSDTIITAAHCPYYGGKNWTAYIHRHNMTKSNAEERGKEYRVKSVKIHKEYIDDITLNDIAIMKIESDECNNNSETLINLDSGKYGYSDNLMLQAMGWGQILEDTNDVQSNILREVKVPLINIDKCIDLYKYREDPATVFPNSMVCAGYDNGGKDICTGDSGGPLGILKGGKFTLIGITSWGWGCARELTPSVYTRISYYLDWIKDNI